MKIIITKGDITKLDHYVGAIVNAANEKLLPGGGVCGSIYRAAGNGLYDECMRLAPCKTGNAVITKSYNLSNHCSNIIHAVGPIYKDYCKEVSEELLISTYVNSVDLAVSNGLSSIAFPAISAGIYGYPVEEAARIAMMCALNRLIKYDDKLKFIEFVLFDDHTYVIFNNALNKLKETTDIMCNRMIGEKNNEE